MSEIKTEKDKQRAKTRNQHETAKIICTETSAVCAPFFFSHKHLMLRSKRRKKKKQENYDN